MIRGTLGFGVCDHLGATLTFDQPTNAGNPGNPSFDQVVSGPGGTGGGLGAQKWNGNQLYTRVLDLQADWAIGMNIMPFYQVGSSPLWAQNKFLQFSSPSAAVIAFEIQTSGTIAVISGGNGTTGTGTLIAQTSNTFPVGSWSGYLEFTITGTTVEIWLDDAKILSCTVPSLGSPDRWAIGNQNGSTFGVNARPFFGMTYANIYVLDGQGSAPWNARLGPVRITTLSPAADAQGNYNITPNTITTRFGAVDDLFPADGNGSPDFDHSYISPVTIGDRQYFTFRSPNCFGLILGVMVNMCFRGSTGSTTCDARIIQGANDILIGTTTVTLASGMYATRQAFIAQSPATSTNFTDGEIAGALWGIGTGSPGLIFTQMFLEKIVSLRASPFNCGQSSYSY